MAEMPVRLGPQVRLGPPFGGITRIRFKGSPAKSTGLSATRLPRIYLVQSKSPRGEVNVHRAATGDRGYRCRGGRTGRKRLFRRRAGVADLAGDTPALQN
jgi:hypothetical protein